ncbi:non-hydrolyzing UDP-N-acetylglucosamine 2-epimerase [Falsiroseomonas oryziterrae]|uniref:non-hydrolyzing UDP-N-acetylglucosamine 2-epimerase n=1 Tax=Falsiroseomonas oryziterrae TaxID=2911368 RepID=UPI001F007612|nr:UDP-N-acetylglucosamine 2-epimerase (non-hydrolyzing) [Roseomonas sp. NPKOSM-4]
MQTPGPSGRVMLVFGTRPEAIKMLPVLGELRRRGLAPFALSTGQHREMLDQALAAFGERCDEDLDLMAQGQELPDLLARILLGVAAVLQREKPPLVLVHGDTTTALAAALAAFHLRIPVGHVEAGQRSRDLARPFPEELNRVAVDALATLRFAATDDAARNLRSEYNAAARIHVTGNTGIDALLNVAARLASSADASEALVPGLDPRKRVVMVTAHRRETLGEGLEGICDAVRALAARGDVEIVWPLHRNPLVRGPVRRRLAQRPGIHLLDPLGYREMVWLMCRSTLLLTDSGGLQEEGPALAKPVLVLRDVTERPEAVATGVVRLVGTDPRRILAEVEALLDDRAAYRAMARHAFPFGDGTAARRIADAIEAWTEEQAPAPRAMPPWLPRIPQGVLEQVAAR